MCWRVDDFHAKDLLELHIYIIFPNVKLTSRKIFSFETKTNAIEHKNVKSILSLLWGVDLTWEFMSFSKWITHFIFSISLGIMKIYSYAIASNFLLLSKCQFFSQESLELPWVSGVNPGKCQTKWVTREAALSEELSSHTVAQCQRQSASYEIAS